MNLGNRIAALDVSKNRIGVAISDSTKLISGETHIYIRSKWTIDLKYIREFIINNSITLIVIGLPLLMNGQRGARCQSIYDFVINIKKGGVLTPIQLWDERRSTIAAKIFLQDKKKRKTKYVDDVVAFFLLQEFLDYQQNCIRPITDV